MKIYSIYRVTNIINNKLYIGFTSQPLTQRKYQHKSSSKYLRRNNKFHNAIKKYGYDNFFWEIIYQSKDYEHCLHEMEPFFIKECNSYNNGYNSTSGGEGTNNISEESRYRISLGRKGIPSWNAGLKVGASPHHFEKKSPEFCALKKIQNSGINSPTYGKIWINNGLENKFVSEEIFLLEYPLWLRGRIMRHNTQGQFI